MRIGNGGVAAVGALALALAASVAVPAQAYSPNPKVKKALATPAQAYDPDPSVFTTRKWTELCPCFLDDGFEGTYFKRDIGGIALKVILYSTAMVGKIEFHPYGEKLWLYDTRDDGDTYWVRVTWDIGFGDTITRWYRPPSTSATVDKRVIKLAHLPEGGRVWIKIYDRKGSDLIKKLPIGRG